MKKLFAIFTAVITFGVIFIGTTITGEIAPGYDKGCILVEGNASFLTPIPINYTLIKIVPTHEIYIGSAKFSQIIYE